MFQTDFIISFILIALLFIRQVMILKLPNKISYAPLMLGLGVVSSLIHFIINPQIDSMLLLRESLFPLLFALLLFMVMNVMQQNQESENAKYKEDFSQTIVDQIDELKSFVSDLETRMLQYSQEDRTMQENIRKQFKTDIKALDSIQTNQMKLFSKFDEVELWHQNVSKEFENFTEVQVPALDKVVHKHIDMLRVSEQDHYNRLKIAIENSLDGGIDISKDMEELKESIKEFQNLSSSISKMIVKESVAQLSDLTQSYKGDIITLKSHAEGMKTSLFEAENKLTTMKQQTDEMLEQIKTSSEQVEGLKEQNGELYALYSVLKDLVKDVEAIKSDYTKSQAQLSLVAHELKDSEDETLLDMKKQIEGLAQTLTDKIETSLEKLHEHYHIAGEDITHSVQLLSQKAKLQKEYGSSEQT